MSEAATANLTAQQMLASQRMTAAAAHYAAKEAKEAKVAA